MLSIQQRVQNGIELLNEKKPGWRDKIDLSTLNTAQCDQCVLGQIFGDYSNGFICLDIDDPQDMYEHGFTNFSVNEVELTDEWRCQLAL